MISRDIHVILGTQGRQNQHFPDLHPYFFPCSSLPSLPLTSLPSVHPSISFSYPPLNYT